MYDLSIEGWMSEEELKQIEIWASSVPPDGVIVEVGSFKGRSTVAWATACHPSVTVYAIDKFHDSRRGDFYNEFLSNTSHLKNIKPLRGETPKKVKYEGTPIDVFFLDAAHVNPTDTIIINYYLPFIKKGGILCGHDYYDKSMFDLDFITTYDVKYFSAVNANVKFLEVLLKKEVTLYRNTTLWSFAI